LISSSHVRFLFVTGTDTGVGKTVVTALLLSHLRQTGVCAIALKPFCTGSRADVHLLHALQEGEPTVDEVNPFYFPEPLAPLIAARQHRHTITLEQAVRHIRSVASHPFPSVQSQEPLLVLIEGAGGLFAPLGKEFCALDLLRQLNCEVLIVARNKLGMINHSLLTLEALRHASVSRIKIVVVDTASAEPSRASNPATLAELATPVRLFVIPFLGRKPKGPRSITRAARQLRCQLSNILGM
jgi:dethiobiotin synthetase